LSTLCAAGIRFLVPAAQTIANSGHDSIRRIEARQADTPQSLGEYPHINKAG
jgi:hypothetical protein